MIATAQTSLNTSKHLNKTLLSFKAQKRHLNRPSRLLSVFKKTHNIEIILYYYGFKQKEAREDIFSSLFHFNLLKLQYK